MRLHWDKTAMGFSLGFSTGMEQPSRCGFVTIDSPAPATEFLVGVPTTVSGTCNAGATVTLTWQTGEGSAGTVTYPTSTTWTCNVRATVDDLSETGLVAAAGGATDTLAITVDFPIPSDYSLSAIQWLDAREGVEVTGSDVDQWTSLEGAINATQTGGNRPTYSATSWVDSGPSITCTSGSAHHLEDNGVAASLTGLQTFTIVSLIQYISGAGYQSISGCNGSPQWIRDWAVGGYYSGIGARGNGSTTKYAGYTAPLNSGLWAGETALLAKSYNSATKTVTVYRNGLKVANADLDVGALTVSNWAIGTYGTAAEYLNGRIRNYGLLSQTITDADYRNLSVMMLGRAYAHVVIEGDSIANQASAYALAVWNPASEVPRYTMTDVATGGDKLDPDVIGDYAGQVEPLYVADGRDYILYLHGGSNDIAAGTSAADALVDFWWEVDEALGDGFKVVGIDMLPRTDLTEAQEAQRVLFNAGLVAGAAARGSDFKLYRPSQITELQDPANATYYSDGIHPTATGYGILVAGAKAHLDELTR